MTLPYGRHSIGRDDLEAVLETLQSDFLTTGPKAIEFENAFADYVGAKYAVAVSSGTAALHLAAIAAGLGPGDRVVTSPNTFLSSANCAAFVGATPDFSDIDPITYNLCANQLADNWKPDTQAVVAVDYAGQTADMPAIAEVARSHGAIVIEDACHAVGSRFVHADQTWTVGGHPWADITIFSFHPVKTMTAGEGGMIVTDNRQYAETARRLRISGVTRQPDELVGLGIGGAFDERGPWYYEMQDLGFNYRITDFQCALGLNQLGKVEQFIARRREIVQKYNQAFADVPAIQTPGLRNELDRDLTSWHLYTVQIDFEEFGLSRTELMNELRYRGVGSQVLYIPVHLQPWYQKTYGYSLGKCPIAERYYQRALSLPLYPTMTDEEVDTVIEVVTGVLNQYGTFHERCHYPSRQRQQASTG